MHGGHASMITIRGFWMGYCEQWLSLWLLGHSIWCGCRVWKFLSRLTGPVFVRLEGCLFTVGCIICFHGFKDLWFFWVSGWATCFWMSMIRLCRRKFVMKVIGSLYYYIGASVGRRFPFFHVLWHPFIASTGTTNDIHSQTSILYRDIYWGKIQRTCQWPMKSQSFWFL